MSWLKRFRDDRGVSAVEFALVAPVLFLLLVGIVDLGRAVNAYVTVSNAAREGTHYLSIHATAAPAAIASAVNGRVYPLDATKVTVTASYFDGATFQPWPTGAIVPNPSPSYTPVRVEVSYPWSSATFIGSFFPGGGARFDVTSTVQMLR